MAHQLEIVVQKTVQLSNLDIGREKEYQEYLLTEVWNSKRKARLIMDDYKCRICNRRAECVHHRKYPKIFGNESLSDLTSLCNHCHNLYHNRPDLDEVKKHVDELAQCAGGTECPVCKRHFQYYKRSITKAMANALIQLYKYDNLNPGEFIHMESYFKSINSLNHAARGDAAKLLFWDLIECDQPKKSTSRSSSGNYKITRLGREFVENQVSVPKYAIIVRGELQDKGGIPIKIRDVVENFNIGELLNSNGRLSDLHSFPN